MKRPWSLLGTCLAALITVSAASQASHACATYIYGMSQDGDHVHCNLTGSSRDWCYYSCECHARTGGDCEDVYADLGLVSY
jgi:hypothetical protein